MTRTQTMSRLSSAAVAFAAFAALMALVAGRPAWAAAAGPARLDQPQGVIQEAVVCSDTDDQGRPVADSSVFPAGTERIGLYVHLAAPETRTTVDLRLLHGKEPLQTYLVTVKGDRQFVWWIAPASGGQFEAGEYSFEVRDRDERICALDFSVGGPAGAEAGTQSTPLEGQGAMNGASTAPTAGTETGAGEATSQGSGQVATLPAGTGTVVADGAAPVATATGQQGAMNGAPTAAGLGADQAAPQSLSAAARMESARAVAAVPPAMRQGEPLDASGTSTAGYAGYAGCGAYSDPYASLGTGAYGTGYPAAGQATIYASGATGAGAAGVGTAGYGTTTGSLYGAGNGYGAAYGSPYGNAYGSPYGTGCGYSPYAAPKTGLAETLALTAANHYAAGALQSTAQQAAQGGGTGLVGDLLNASVGWGVGQVVDGIIGLFHHDSKPPKPFHALRPEVVRPFVEGLLQQSDVQGIVAQCGQVEPVAYGAAACAESDKLASGLVVVPLAEQNSLGCTELLALLLYDGADLLFNGAPINLAHTFTVQQGKREMHAVVLRVELGSSGAMLHVLDRELKPLAEGPVASALPEARSRDQFATVHEVVPVDQRGDSALAIISITPSIAETSINAAVFTITTCRAR